MDESRNFLEYVLKVILDDFDSVNISKKEDELGILYELQVSAQDMGKLIGKDGRTIKSIRTLLRMIGSKSNERVNLKVLEPAS